MKEYDFASLNDAQREAVTTTEGPVLIIAGPGTGKTFTLVKRISYLVTQLGVAPGEIMCVTFTQKAAKELLTRISNELIKYDESINVNDMYLGTFHSVCLRIMKENSEYIENGGGRRMLDAFEQTYLVCRSIESFRSISGFADHIRAKSVWRQSLEICRYVNLLTEELADVDAMECDADPDMRFLAKLVKRYRELLRRRGALDFSTVQTAAYDMLRMNPALLSKVREGIKYIMVDEYQDTNYIQEQLLMLIAGDRHNICAVGDDDQGMYRFRGATIRNILEFPDKFAAGECKKIHLDVNYRSEPQIIGFYSRWMENADGVNVFNWNNFRYEKHIRAAKEPRHACGSVYSCTADSVEEQGVRLLSTIQRLIKSGNIGNLNQIAFLFRSVKSNEAVEIGRFLEKNGIPVYSPRSDMFFERDEVKRLLGCLMMCFQSYTADIKNDRFRYTISDDLKSYYKSCLKAAVPLIKADPALYDYIGKTIAFIRKPGETSEIGLLTMFYHIIAAQPFKEYLQADSADIRKSRAARNLSELSRMLSRFSHLHDMHAVTEQNKTAMPEELFNIYLRFMIDEGIGEYEDESEYAPSGCVSFMTVHQAKGLEFPAVVACSLSGRPRQSIDNLLYSAESRFFHRRPFEPLSDIRFFDFYRLYYTAFSRAQDLLILAGKTPVGKHFAPYVDKLPDIEMFDSAAAFSGVKAAKYKRVYSFTSHISIYDGCPKQYKYFKEYAFARNKMKHTAIGTLVHETLEDINRRAIAGRAHEVTETSISEWLMLNYSALQEHTGFYLTEEERENALSQVLSYYDLRRDHIKRVWKAEQEINLVLPDFILQGVIDLIESNGDTVEIVDYKTGPKPDISKEPQRVAHYRRQLEIYAYLTEKRYGRRVSRMHLYYTSRTDGDPLITFERTDEAIKTAISEAAQTIANIEGKRFEEGAKDGLACAFCDMRCVCGMEPMGKQEKENLK
ncbi:MAG: ATP-dependent helicase [Clostridia bacterium]|nr:ATP-dependent helicase [Clostridia bacterium]